MTVERKSVNDRLAVTPAGVTMKSAGGRPPKPESERTVVATIRLTPERKVKLRKLGAAWLSRMLDESSP